MWSDGGSIHAHNINCRSCAVSDASAQQASILYTVAKHAASLYRSLHRNHHQLKEPWHFVTTKHQLTLNHSSPPASFRALPQLAVVVDAADTFKQFTLTSLRLTDCRMIPKICPRLDATVAHTTQHSDLEPKNEAKKTGRRAGNLDELSFLVGRLTLTGYPRPPKVCRDSMTSLETCFWQPPKTNEGIMLLFSSLHPLFAFLAK
jgi:hypothetical protein